MPLAVPSRIEEFVEREADAAVPAPVFAPVAAEAGSAGELQRLAVEALGAAALGSAADAMEDAAWTLSAGEAMVQTTLSKTMLPVVMNAEAEKIARVALRAAGALKLTLLPGVAAAHNGEAKKVRAARAGSANARALEHPMVQQAQRLFGAEIQSVIDLRDGE